MHKLSLKCLSQFFGFGKIQVLIGWIGLLNSGNLTLAVEAKNRAVCANGCKMLCMDVIDEKCLVAFVAQKVDPAILMQQITIGRLC